MSEPSPPTATAASATAPVALDVRGLGKRFGQRVALADVSFGAAEGELLAVIGPNGAGKTTLLSIVAGSLPADAGQIEISAGRVGFVPQRPALYSRCLLYTSPSPRDRS